MRVPAGSVWGQHDVERLRSAGWVVVTEPRMEAPQEPVGWGMPDRSTSRASARAADGSVVPGASLDDAHLWAMTVHALALAGVPTGTTDLPSRVRHLLHPAVLAVADAVDASTADDRDRREQLSVELRRAAWQVGPGRWYLPAPATVLVLTPEDASAPLLADLAAQEQVVVRTAAPQEPGPLDAVDFVTRVDAEVRYSPYHLSDLVHGLLHSRASVAHSPDRFRRHHDGAWLEQEGLAERPASSGLAAGSLWHAASGRDRPEGPGYAVHGANAVRAGTLPAELSGVMRWHETLPVHLGWLDEDDAPACPPSSSYPARKVAGARSRDLTSTTASES